MCGEGRVGGGWGEGGCHDCMNEPLAWREEEGEGRGEMRRQGAGYSNDCLLIIT